MMQRVQAGVSPISIRTRILVMVLALIAVVFLLVLGAFNLLVEDYIETSVRSQLSRTLQGPTLGVDQARPPRGPGGSDQMMIITDEYILVQPDPSMLRVPWSPDASALADQLRSQGVNLASREIVRMSASGREYYLVTVPTQYETGGRATYLVHYVDMTALAAFASRINSVLLLVMAVAASLAAVIAMFLSNRIAEPIRQLTRFAARIGEGDFARSGTRYHDTELAELAGSMEKAAAQLEAYENQQRTLFQNVSHELRTPLQAIRSNAEGIEHRILDGQKASRIIVSETRRLTEMVDDLLYMSRIEGNPMRRAIEQWDLREILSNCVERQRTLADERAIEMVFDFAAEPVNLLCDEDHLSRAFSNIVSNAIRYARSRVTLSCHNRGEGAVITVLDDGEGIAVEDLPHIFDRFYKGRGGKHGIGLALAKAVIEQHSGRIEAANTADGAAFTITF